ncbi:MAG: hypothetical protein CMQ49_13440 [Gammaproteobacteria bacterium]|nr:hypothetical protein [Gammaproteobacteria bacterium]
MTDQPRVAGLPLYFLPFVSAMVGLGPFAIDTYLPALPSMAAYFQAGIVALNLTVSTYLFGFGIGQLIGGPISDQIGRKPVGLVGLALFIIATIAIMYSASALEIQILRGLQAIGGGFATVICNAMVRDAFEPAEAAKRFPMVMLVMLVAPLIAPVLGSFLMDLGWQAIFVFLGAYALMLMLAFARVPETVAAPTGRISLASILPQYLEVLTTRVDGKLIPARYMAAMGSVGSVMMVFITNSAFIYLEYFDVGEKWFGVFFGANVLMMMVFSAATTRLIHRVAPHRLFRFGCTLQAVAMGLLLVLSVTLDMAIWWFTPLLALCIGAAGMINPSVSGLFLAHFDRLSGSASSLMSLTVFMLGATMGVVSGLFFDGTLVPVVLTMGAAVLTANLVAFSIPRPAGFVGAASQPSSAR